MSYKEKRPKIRTVIKDIEVDDKELLNLSDGQLQTVLGGRMSASGPTCGGECGCDC